MNEKNQIYDDNQKKTASDVRTDGGSSPFDLNDPKGTAYLLGELTESEAAEMEAVFKDHPDYRAELDSLRAVADRLREALTAEPIGVTEEKTPPFSKANVSTATDAAQTSDAAQTAEVLKATDANPQRARFLPVRYLTAAALLLAVSLTGYVLYFGGNREKSPLARQEVLRQKETASPDVPPSPDVPSAPFQRESNLKPDSLPEAEKANAAPSRERTAENGSVLPEKKKARKEDAELADRSEISSDLSEAAPAKSERANTAADADLAENFAREIEKPAISAPAVAEALPPESGPMMMVTPKVLPFQEDESGHRMKAASKIGGAVAVERDAVAAGGAAGERVFSRIEEISDGQEVMFSDREEKVSSMPTDQEGYRALTETPFITPAKEPFSTFSIDVDTASYANVRRYLENGQLPPPDAVRIEEMINYFDYPYAPPAAEEKVPFAVLTDVAACPWAADHKIARIGIKGREIPKAERPPMNLVFLVDVSGSMSDHNKLPLVQRGLTELVEELDARDKIAIVTYANGVQTRLESTPGNESAKILRAIDDLSAGGSTAGADGIQTAYKTARGQFDAEASNRVILATDGDFNVGLTDNGELEKMIEREAKSGVFLTVLGFGMGNVKDDRLSILSNKGNGNYGYVDSITEARRLLVEKLTGTLVTIAKDVKIQIDFNPAQVAAYRLIGYEDRMLAAEDFNNDRKDAGEIGAGHTVTALYEIVPTGVAVPGKMDESRYAPVEKTQDEQAAQNAQEKQGAQEGNAESPNADEKNAESPDAAPSEFADEWMFVKLRYKDPDGTESQLITRPVQCAADDGEKEVNRSDDFDFACAVALFGMLLKGSDHSGTGTYDQVLELAEKNVAASAEKKTKNRETPEEEFRRLVETAKTQTVRR